MSSDARKLDAAARARREAELRLSMAERLARLHHLAKQMTAIKGAAKRS
jgi:hypothetical protein